MMRSHAEQLEIYDRLPAEIRAFLAAAPFHIDSGAVELAWGRTLLPMPEFLASLERMSEKHAAVMNEMTYGQK